MHHTTNRGIPLPDGAEPYAVGLIALVAIFLLWWAFRCARDAEQPKKIRIGNALGFTGFAVWCSTLALMIALDARFTPPFVAAFVTGFVLAGVGGTLAGWSRN